MTKGDWARVDMAGFIVGLLGLLGLVYWILNDPTINTAPKAHYAITLSIVAMALFLNGIDAFFKAREEIG
jgi:hypothetical protein